MWGRGGGWVGDVGDEGGGKGSVVSKLNGFHIFVLILREDEQSGSQ